MSLRAAPTKEDWKPPADGLGGRGDEETLRRLMVEYQQGSAVAADELVRRISPLLLRFMEGRTSTRGHAEDMLQECWLRMHRARHAYDANQPVLPWVFAIARYTRIDGFRRRSRHEAREVPVDEAVASPAPASTASGAGDLEGLLADLPESQREVLWMLKVSGMTLEEVARATSSTVGAVKQKAHRAYEKLRRRLRDRSAR